MIGTPWLIGGAAALSIAVVVGAYWQGHRAGEAACELRVERAIAAEQKRQSTAFSESLEAVTKQAEKTETENANLQDMVTKYENSLARRTDACLLDDTDARGLSGIR
jgi:hypothetical protein